MSHKNTVCVHEGTHHTDSYTDMSTMSEIFCGGHIGQNHWATNQRRNGNKLTSVSASTLLSQCAAMMKMCQSHGEREGGPILLWERPAVGPHFSFLLCHFILPQQEVQCANSSSQTELVILWTHTQCAFITLCRCPTLALTITHLHLSYFKRSKPSEFKVLLYISLADPAIVVY